MSGRNSFSLSALFLACLVFMSCSDGVRQSVIFEDGFAELPTGDFCAQAGEKASCGYLQESAQKGGWTFTGYGKDPGYRTAWQVKEDLEGTYMAQTFRNLTDDLRPLDAGIHPLLTAGDSLWHDYTVEFSFKPHLVIDKCGVAFRMQSPRSFYFFGMEGNNLVIKLVDGESAPHRPFERILAHKSFNWEPGVQYKGVVTLREDKIFVLLNDSISMMAYDRTLPRGRIGLISDIPADFYRVEVRILNNERRKILRRQRSNSVYLTRFLDENPKPVVWRKILTAEYGSRAPIRFADLDNDGEKELIVVQMKAVDSRAPVPSCITAVESDGEILWQYGKPDTASNGYCTDIPLQIIDMDDDGMREVIWFDGRYLLSAEGKSGRITARREIHYPVPSSEHMDKNSSYGLMFCDLTANGKTDDIVFKDQFGYLHAFNGKLELLWTYGPVNCEFPSLMDRDNDGRPEIAAGYVLLDADGKVIWNLEERFGGENRVMSVGFRESYGKDFRMLMSAGEWGLAFLDSSGNIRNYKPAGDVLSATVADFNRDLPGLETVTINFWGSQGLVNMYDSNGDIYRTFETVPFGSKCLPVNWKGDGEEYFLLNADPGDGGLFNGTGHIAVVFPDDGHPVTSCTTADLKGDPRDELVVWDEHEIWIYSQSDNPRGGRTYDPVREPAGRNAENILHISLPMWSL